MTTPLETVLTLRTQLRALHASKAVGAALMALDTVEASIRHAQSADVKAQASVLAGVDVDTLRPVEKRAWLNLVSAKATAAEEAAAPVQVAAEADAEKTA